LPKLYENNEAKDVKIIDDSTGEIKQLMEESIILNGLSETIRIERIYVPKEHAEKAKTILSKISRREGA